MSLPRCSGNRCYSNHVIDSLRVHYYQKLSTRLFLQGFPNASRTKVAGVVGSPVDPYTKPINPLQKCVQQSPAITATYLIEIKKMRSFSSCRSRFMCLANEGLIPVCAAILPRWPSLTDRECQLAFRAGPTSPLVGSVG